MTPRIKAAMAEAMAQHAVWCHTGNTNPGGKSLMARLMESKGHFNFGSNSGPRNGPTNSLPERIEAAMMKLAQKDLLQADCLRLEYGAGALNVVKRRKLRIRWHEATQLQKAEALKISERTYRNKITAGLTFILEEVTK